MKVSGIRGISRLELKTKTENWLNPVTKAKTCATYSSNGALSESFKNKPAEKILQDYKKLSASRQKRYRRSNTFPWGRNGFSVTQTSENKITARAYAASTQHEVPN